MHYGRLLLVFWRRGHQGWCPMLNTNFPASCVSNRLIDSMAMSALLVDSDPELRDSRYLLSSSLHIPVHTVTSYAEVFLLTEPSCYNLVVLSTRPNDKQASYVAVFVRNRWPTAKILLLGENCGCLDDPMYDDIVNPRYNSAGLVQAAQRLLEWVRTGRILPWSKTPVLLPTTIMSARNDEQEAECGESIATSRAGNLA